MLFGNKGTRGENEHSVVREVAQKKLVKEDRVSEHSNGYSIGQVTPGSRRSIDNLDQVSSNILFGRQFMKMTITSLIFSC